MGPFFLVLEVGEHGAAVALQQVEGGGDDTVLILGVVGFAEGIAVGEGDEEASRRLDLSTCRRTRAMEVVTRPAASKTRASTPTVCEQRGQVGVRKTTSTPSALRRCAASGPVSSMMGVASRWAPMNE